MYSDKESPNDNNGVHLLQPWADRSLYTQGQIIDNYVVSIVFFLRFLRGNLGVRCRAATIVGKCSSFSRALATLLSITLGWPGSWCSLPTKGLDSNTARFFERVATKDRTTAAFKTTAAFNLGPRHERLHASAGRALVDDVAVLSDDSEEWVEDTASSWLRAGLVPSRVGLDVLSEPLSFLAAHNSAPAVSSHRVRCFRC